MKRIDLIIAAVFLAATVSAWFGLFHPLVEVPLVGAIRYAEHNLGGKEMAWIVVGLLGVGAVISPLAPAAKRLAYLLGGIALGLVAASFFAIYRFTLDQLMQLGDADAFKLLNQAKVQPGLIVLAIGLALWLGGALASVFLGGGETKQAAHT